MSVAADLVGAVRAGRPRAVARAISLTERGGPDAAALVARLHGAGGTACRVGVTGPAGVGKSTLVAALVGHVRALGRRVGVVSVDPTSPFTRGALLGDRIRLAEHYLDEAVFIRSMATRGHLGGLAAATSDAVLVLEAAGFDLVLVETVGAGQGEVEIQSIAETVVLALMPGSGDAIQAIKAGLMEIPDVIAITKADVAGADRLRAELEGALALAPAGDWRPPVVPVVAPTGAGVAELWAAIESHERHLDRDGRRERRRREGAERLLRSRALDRVQRAIERDPGLTALADAVAARELAPAQAVECLLRSLADELVAETSRPAG